MADRSLRQDLVLILATALCGAGLTYMFQQRSAAHQEERDLREARRHAATELFEDVGRLMDRRLFLWTRLYGALREGLSDTTEQEKTYRVTVADWNATLLTNEALICRYFGIEAGRTFVRSVVPGFGRLDRALVEYRKLPFVERRGRDALVSDYVSQRQAIFRFNLELVDRIRSGIVATADAGAQCSSLVPAQEQNSAGSGTAPR